MNLRAILITLTLCTFLGATGGGFYYIEALKHSVITESEIQTVLSAEKARNRFSAYLNENTRVIQTMALTPSLSAVLANPTSKKALHQANLDLDQFQRMLQADVCYLLNFEGTVLASSNRNETNSFIGKNYAFRPYFSDAISGGTGIYMALGITSGKRGIYYSHPVYASPNCQPVGIAVIKSALEPLEKEWQKAFNNKGDLTLITNKHGIIFITSQKNWRFKALWKLDAQQTAALTAKRQFGTGPWEWTGIKRANNHRAIDRNKNEYLLHTIDLHSYPGWQVVQLSNLEAAINRLAGPEQKRAGLIFVITCALIGGLLFLLFRKANQELTRRQLAEQKLRQEHRILESILATSPVAIGILNDRIFESANNAFLKLFGFNKTEDYKGKSSRIIYTSEEEYQRVGKVLYTATDHEQPKVVKAELKRIDGSNFSGLIRISSPDPAHPMDHAVFTMSDITPIVEEEEERLKREKLQSVLETAGAVCHEINQPLMAISGHCSIGQKLTTPGEPPNRQFVKIMEAMNRIAEIIRKLSSIAHYKTRRYLNDTQIIDIEESSTLPDQDESS